jgi:hypothetical protein
MENRTFWYESVARVSAVIRASSIALGDSVVK